MSSAAVMPSRPSTDTLTRRPTSGNRRRIVAGIDASAARYGNPIQDEDNHTHPVPISNTDALLRSRKGSQDSSTNPTAPPHASNTRSRSSLSIPQSRAIPSSPSRGSQRSSARSRARSGSANSTSPHAENVDGDQGQLAVPDKNGKSWGSSSVRLRRRSSNLSQKSWNNETDLNGAQDDRSISSRKSSKASGLSSLLRRRSRTASIGNNDSEVAADLSGGSNTTAPSRLRTFSGTARKMSLKLDTRSRNGSVSSLFSPSKQESVSPEDADLPPPVPALPEALQASGGPIRKTSEGYKTLQSPTPEGDSFADSPRSRRYTRQRTPSASNESGFTDPFAKADATLARARSKGLPKSNVALMQSGTNVPESPKNAGIDEEDVTPADSSAEGGNGTLIGSATAAASAAVAGVAGAASTLLGKPNGETPSDRRARSGGSSQYSDDSSDEEFYDAELANITEGSEEEDDDHDGEGEKDDVHHAEREEGIGAVSSKSRASSSRAGRRNGRSKSATTAAGASYKPKGTAGASRRAGSVSAGDGVQQVATSADAKAKGDVPQHIRDKSARVARLSLDDVRSTPQEMRDDIEVARKALNLFLNSRMLEAEKIVLEHADTKLYYALGCAIIATIKGFMTFEPADLATAISLCKDSLTIANLLRKPSSSVANFGRFVRGTGQSPSSLASMDMVQRHAELVYAESLLLKAVLGIVYAGDFFAFVSEALNMRNAYGIYRSLSKYVEWAEEKGMGGEIDEDFKSGVYLGNGLISMILGLVPGKVLKIMEVFGYTGDTAWALKTLSKAGGWSTNPSEKKPGMSQKEEGVRRQICDMGLLLYHLVISTFIPVNGVDIPFADKVLHYNLKRYPDGVFFLYFSGRLYSTQALSEKAVTQFETARDVQKEYVQLKHICIWDLALCHMSLCDWQGAYENFKIMAEENNWSKAVYNYGRASTLYEGARGEDTSKMQNAADIFRKVPNLTQKIAGKSIPMEKFVARKAKKFNTYNRLLLPGLEFSYVYHCLSNAPRFILADEALILVSDALADLHEVEDPSRYYSGEEYYDDLALAHFLRGVCLKFIAYPERHSKVRPKESPIPENEAAEQAEMSFKTVLEHGSKLKLDHWLVYFAHYELGRLYAGMGKTAEAKEQLNLVLSQKTLEDRGRKGKYSLQNMVHLRANGALNALEGN